jgi:hypothetical protein
MFSHYQKLHKESYKETLHNRMDLSVCKIFHLCRAKLLCDVEGIKLHVEGVHDIIFSSYKKTVKPTAKVIAAIAQRRTVLKPTGGTGGTGLVQMDRRRQATFCLSGLWV